MTLYYTISISFYSNIMTNFVEAAGEGNALLNYSKYLGKNKWKVCDTILLMYQDYIVILALKKYV